MHKAFHYYIWKSNDSLEFSFQFEAMCDSYHVNDNDYDFGFISIL